MNKLERSHTQKLIHKHWITLQKRKITYSKYNRKRTILTIPANMQPRLHISKE